jgi:hypothetical protein
LRLRIARPELIAAVIAKFIISARSTFHSSSISAIRAWIGLVARALADAVVVGGVPGGVLHRRSFLVAVCARGTMSAGVGGDRWVNLIEMQWMCRETYIGC